MAIYLNMAISLLHVPLNVEICDGKSHNSDGEDEPVSDGVTDCPVGTDQLDHCSINLLEVISLPLGCFLRYLL